MTHHSSARRRVSHRIVDEARKQGAHFVGGAAANCLTGEIHFEIELFALGQRRVIRYGFEHERVDVHHLVQGSTTLLKPGQMEQLVHERARTPNPARKGRRGFAMGVCASRARFSSWICIPASGVPSS